MLIPHYFSPYGFDTHSGQMVPWAERYRYTTILTWSICFVMFTFVLVRMSCGNNDVVETKHIISSVENKAHHDDIYISIDCDCKYFIFRMFYVRLIGCKNLTLFQRKIRRIRYFSLILPTYYQLAIPKWSQREINMITEFNQPQSMSQGEW